MARKFKEGDYVYVTKLQERNLNDLMREHFAKRRHVPLRIIDTDSRDERYPYSCADEKEFPHGYWYAEEGLVLAAGQTKEELIKQRNDGRISDQDYLDRLLFLVKEEA